ncbi:MAG: hypothetical protein CMO01_09810 [Thalassobius sp.]|nr:hypothetical protein [Thalassovita sp.]
MKLNFKLTAIVAVIIFGCLEEYTPDLNNNDERILVVEGRIGNDITKIQLSRTTEVGYDSLASEVKARVNIEDENENVIAVLPEVTNGVYQDSLPLEFDRKYRVRITTSDEQEYLSEAMEIFNTPPIDSVFWEDTPNGISINVSTHDDADNSRYYQWDFDETYVYRVMYYSNYYFQASDTTVLRRNPEDQVYYCWQSYHNQNIKIGSTIQFAENVVSKKSLTEITPTDNLKFSIKYSINVIQSSISEDYYNFLDLLRANSEDLGSIFGPQPSLLTSNVSSVNSDNKVIGYISANTLEEKRIFIERLDIPYRDIPAILNTFCYDTAVVNTPENLYEQFGQLNGLIPLDAIYGSSPIPYSYSGAPPSCADCTTGGGVNIEPDFWE